MKISSLTNFSSFFDDFIFVTSMQIHELIKTERLKAGLTEDQIADKLGIPRATYQNWEKKTPAVEKIRSVSKVLNLPKDYFFINSDEESGNNEYIIDSEINGGMVQEPAAQYEVKGAVYEGKNFFLALLEEKDRSIKKAEEVAKKMESIYEDAKNEKGKLLNQVDKLADIIDNTLKDISSNLKVAAASLAQNNQLTALLKDQTYIVSDQLEYQREALGLGLPGEKRPQTQPVTFVKKGKASSGSQHDGGKKSKGH
jgi:transcriptional regulator with XRE-family HTH domain